MNAAIPERRPATEGISGLIERVTFHNDENGFCVLRVSDSSGEPSQAGAIV
jgi:exodeoxyribonuclease V alpha subunit